MKKQSIVDNSCGEASFACPHGCGAVIHSDDYLKIFDNIFSSTIDTALPHEFHEGFVINWQDATDILHMDLFDMPCCKKLVAIDHQFISEGDFIMKVSACRSETDIKYLKAIGKIK
jgi:hypothetical protein